MSNKNVLKTGKLTNVIYVPVPVRYEIEKTTIELSWYLKRHINPSLFIQYLFKEYGQIAMKKLISENESFTNVPVQDNKDNSI